MKDSKFNSLPYDTLFTSIAYELIELEVIHNPCIKTAGKAVIFLSVSTYIALQSWPRVGGGHGVIPVPQRLMIRCYSIPTPSSCDGAVVRMQDSQS